MFSIALNLDFSLLFIIFAALRTKHNLYLQGVIKIMGIKNTKATWPLNFPQADETIVVPDGPSEKLTFSGRKWINYNGRLIAVMPSHTTGNPPTAATLRFGYPSKLYTEIALKITESVVLYDTRFKLESLEANPQGCIHRYEVSKVAKEAPIEFILDSPTQFTFETVAHYFVDGTKYYITLGSIGEVRVDFYIWNEALETVQILDFSNKTTWCKILDYVFQVKSSTANTAQIVMKKQPKREVDIRNDVTLGFDEIVAFKDNGKEVAIQAVTIPYPGMVELWCTLDEKNKPQVTAYLDRMVKDDKKQFAIAYSITVKSIVQAADQPPRYTLAISVVDSASVNLDTKFVLMKGKSAQLAGTDLTIRYNGSSHKEKSNGGVVGFIHVTTTQNGTENTQTVSVKDKHKTKFEVDGFSFEMSKHDYDVSIELRVRRAAEEKF